MAVKTTIPLETIAAIQKRLRKLPPKETGKTRTEALELLTPDLRTALGKGYSLKELRKIVTEEGATLPLSKLTEKTPADSDKAHEKPVEEIAEKSSGETPETGQRITPKPTDESTGTTTMPQRESREESAEESKAGVEETAEKPPENAGREPPLSLREKAATIAEQAKRNDAGKRQGFYIKPDTPDEEL